MNKIKVYLQYPWKFPDSPYYKYLIDNPPNSIEYLNTTKQKGVITNKKFFLFSNLIKSKIRKIFNKVNVSIPNLHVTKYNGKIDVIHCAHCLSRNEDVPWVADFEGVWQMFIGEKTNKSIEQVRKILLGEKCKKIIAWTEFSKKEITKIFPEIAKKVEVVYPAVSVPKKLVKKHEDINLVFIARYFHEKGGHHAIEVFDRLTKKYPHVKAIVVSPLDNAFIKKYRQNKKISFYDIMPQKELFEKIYPISDIFVYPGYSDSFGFSILETMALGIPVITADTFARKELIKDGKNGFLVKVDGEISFNSIGKNDLKVIGEITKKTELLIKDNNLRKKMSMNCKQIVDKNFSIERRNEKLLKIYKEALRIG